MLEKNLENKTKAKVVDNGIMKVKMVTNEMISESKKELRKMKKKLKELEEKQRITHHTIREICKQHDLKFKNQSKTNIMIELHKKINTMKGRPWSRVRVVQLAAGNRGLTGVWRPRPQARVDEGAVRGEGPDDAGALAAVEAAASIGKGRKPAPRGVRDAAC